MARLASFLLIALGLALAAPSPSHADVDVNALGCGAQVEGLAFLSADLDCSAFPDYAVDVSGTLELRGFTIRGGVSGTVHCFRRCRIAGPGRIESTGFNGVGSLRVVRLQDLAIESAAYGVQAKRVILERSTATAAWVAINAVASTTVIDSTITDCGLAGVVAARGIRLVRSTIQSSGRFGVASYNSRPALLDSTVTGNGTEAGCGVSMACGDIVVPVAPRLFGTSSCARSLVMPDAVPISFPFDPLPPTLASWGVCTLD